MRNLDRSWDIIHRVLKVPIYNRAISKSYFRLESFIYNFSFNLERKTFILYFDFGLKEKLYVLMPMFFRQINFNKSTYAFFSKFVSYIF